MTLRRGFKAEASWFARALRQELGLEPWDPLCPWGLAKHLAIPVIPLSDLRPFAPEVVHALMTRGRDWFSAVTIFVGRRGRRRVICHNDGNAKTRQAADISHELSHAVLGHSAAEMFERDPIAEDEAQWMGPALLVSDEAAIRIAQQGLSLQAAARTFAVSDQLMRMRLNVTAASFGHMTGAACFTAPSHEWPFPQRRRRHVITRLFPKLRPQLAVLFMTAMPITLSSSPGRNSAIAC